MSVLIEMLISFLAEVVVPFLFEMFLYLMIELVGYYVAQFALPLLSSGRIVVRPLGSRDRQGFNWLGYRRDSAGRIEIEPGPAGFLGFLILVFAVIAIVFLLRALSGAAISPR